MDIYNILEFRLFDPILPFWIVEERSWVENRSDRRRIFGSRQRLQRSQLVEVSDEHVAKVGDQGEQGSVTVRHWVLKQGTDTKQKMTFVDPDEPIVVTYLGQTHATLPKRILANDCQLPNLYRDLVIQIECDNLNDLGRRKIFTSTREVITEEGRTQFRDILAKILPEELSELDQERELSLLKQGATKATEELRRRLAEMINRIKPGTFELKGGDKGGRGRRRRKKHRRVYSPLPTKDFPTFIRIGNTNIPIRLSTAWTTWVGLESDAPDDFLTRNQTAITLSEDASRLCKITTHHRDFKGGRLSIGVVPSGDHPDNTQFKLRLEMRASRSGNTCSFDDWKDAIIVTPKQGGGSQKIRLDAPTIEPVNSQHPLWNSNQWNENHVAEVREKEGHTVIYVSVENKWLIGALKNSAYTITIKERLKTKYLLQIAFFAYLQHEGIQNMATGAANIAEQVFDTFKSQSLEWGARSILTAMTTEHAFDKDVEREDVEAV